MTFARNKRFGYLTCSPPLAGRAPSSPSSSLSSSPENTMPLPGQAVSIAGQINLDRQARSV